MSGADDRRAHARPAKLRRGRLSDIAALVALEREAFGDRRFAGHVISRASFRRFLSRPEPTLIVAVAGDRIAGYVLVLYRAHVRRARLYSIGVAAAFRRRGLARRLLQAAQKDAVGRHCGAIRLEVRADQIGAIALYESSGYRSVGRRAGYYGGVDALVLEKPLGRADDRRRAHKPA